MSLFGSSNWVLPPAHFKKGFAEEVPMPIVPGYPLVVQGYEEGVMRCILAFPLPAVNNRRSGITIRFPLVWGFLNLAMLQLIPYRVKKIPVKPSVCREDRGPLQNALSNNHPGHNPHAWGWIMPYGQWFFIKPP